MAINIRMLYKLFEKKKNFHQRKKYFRACDEKKRSILAKKILEMLVFFVRFQCEFESNEHFNGGFCLIIVRVQQNSAAEVQIKGIWLRFHFTHHSNRCWLWVIIFYGKWANAFFWNVYDKRAQIWICFWPHSSRVESLTSFILIPKILIAIILVNSNWAIAAELHFVWVCVWECAVELGQIPSLKLIGERRILDLLSKEN